MEIATQAFWRANLAEFLATLFFVFVNCSVTLTLTTAPSVTQIALCFGLSIAVLVQIFGPTSGANVNPAVTIGLLLGRKISILRAVFYMIFQCGGGLYFIVFLEIYEIRKLRNAHEICLFHISLD